MSVGPHALVILMEITSFRMLGLWIFALASGVVAWDHVSPETLQKSVSENDWTMVACESPVFMNDLSFLIKCFN